LIIAGGDGKSWSKDIAVTLLPQPDSPTSAIISPGYTLKEIPDTAVAGPFRPEKATLRFSTVSTG
jgi:hypothetical protein